MSHREGSPEDIYDMDPKDILAQYSVEWVSLKKAYEEVRVGLQRIRDEWRDIINCGLNLHRLYKSRERLRHDSLRYNKQCKRQTEQLRSERRNDEGENYLNKREQMQ